VEESAEASPDHSGHQHWFEAVAEHLGGAYLRYSFTKGTRQEVDFLVETLQLKSGMRVLDVGCGPGRHAHELARRGIETHGIDISRRFVELAVEHAPLGATFQRMDARDLATEPDFTGAFDAVICLCQGAFGLMTANGDDEVVLSGMARALKQGGVLALSAFSAYFTARYFHDPDKGVTLDAATGVTHEHTEVRNEAGEPKTVDLWTGCYTPRELRVLCRVAGLQVTSISSVEPGAYALGAPTIESPEFLAIARR